MSYVKEIVIAGIVWLESLALYLGYDGAYFGMVIGALSGLGGYEINTWLRKRKDDKE